MWNLLCQYKNIYIYIRKVQTKDPKKKNVTIVATVSPGTIAAVQNFKKKKKKKKHKVPHQNCTVYEQWKNVVWTVAKYCSGITAFYIVNRRKRQIIKNRKYHLSYNVNLINLTLLMFVN